MTVTTLTDGRVREVEFKLDYLSVTFWANVADVMQSVGRYLLKLNAGEDPFAFFKVAAHGGRGFGTMYLGEGMTIYADPLAATSAYVSVEIKGKGLEGLSISDIAEWLNTRGLDGERWQASRVDLTWDYVGFSPAMVNEAAIRGNIRVSSRRKAGWRKFIDSARTEGDERAEDGEGGQTCYIGRKSGSRQLCVYDRRGFNRCEFRCRGERAAKVLYDLLDKEPEPHGWSARAVQHLLDFIAFVDVQSDSCITRAAPLVWWAEFVGNARRAGLKLPRVGVDEVDAARRTRRVATRRLAIQSHVYGIDFVMREIEHASAYLTDIDRIKIARLRKAVAAVRVDLGDDVAEASAWQELMFTEEAYRVF